MNNRNDIIECAEKYSHISYDRSTKCALAYANVGMLEYWLYTFLTVDANAENIVAEIKMYQPRFIGPIHLSISCFSRCCGPEPEMRYYEPSLQFELRVNDLIQKILAGVDLPPLLLYYVDGEFDLFDGAHRYEAYKRLNADSISSIIWTSKDLDYVDFYQKHPLLQI